MDATTPQPDQADVTRYLPFLTVFGVTTAALASCAARREPRPRSALELVEAVLATFYIARVVARERVGAIVREPFVEPAPGADPADAKGDAKQPTSQSRLRQSAGELITCTRCLGPWAGAMITFGDAFAPGPARIITRILALAGANSMAHAVHGAACAAANHDRES